MTVSDTWTHRTVLLNEAVQALHLNPDGHYIDATFGRGGHSRLILSQLSAQGRLTAFDKDLDAMAEAASIQDARFAIRHEGFSHMAQLPAGSAAGILMDLGVSSPQIDKDLDAMAEAASIADARFAIRHEGFSHMAQLPAGSAAGILMDLGVSSPQIDNAARGFSFRGNGPLDMRMDTTRGQSVAQWLADASIESMTEVIRDYGEERFAGQIAKAIDRRRQERGPLGSTAELAEVVAGAVKTREPGKDPATRTFQAFRIFINAELEELQQALSASLKVLQTGGRLVVISFHSLEDRIVKQFIAEHSREVFDRRTPFAAPKAMRLSALGRVKPSEAEVGENPRSRSAVMRLAERTGVPA